MRSTDCLLISRFERQAHSLVFKRTEWQMDGHLTKSTGGLTKHVVLVSHNKRALKKMAPIFSYLLKEGHSSSYISSTGKIYDLKTRLWDYQENSYPSLASNPRWFQVCSEASSEPFHESRAQISSFFSLSKAITFFCLPNQETHRDKEQSRNEFVFQQSRKWTFGQTQDYVVEVNEKWLWSHFNS